MMKGSNRGKAVPLMVWALAGAASIGAVDTAHAAQSKLCSVSSIQLTL